MQQWPDVSDVDLKPMIDEYDDRFDAFLAEQPLESLAILKDFSAPDSFRAKMIRRAMALAARGSVA